jgi:hypothetical protein
MPLQATQIVSLATQIAKCPGFTSQAGQLLNVVLQELCETYDFEVARKTFLFNFDLGQNSGLGPFPLPADYLRAKKDDVYFTISGQPYMMIPVDQSEFDSFTLTAGIQGYPAYMTTDMNVSPPTMSVWPPASGAYPVTVKYYAAMPDIVTPETSTSIPWFPFSNYLVTRLSAELMKITDDERQAKFNVDSEDLLRKYLEMKDDPEGTVNTVSLDRRRFGTPFSRLPNTKLLGW